MLNRFGLILLAAGGACGAPAEAPPAVAARDTPAASAPLPTATLAPRPPLTLRVFRDDAGAVDSIRVLRGGRPVQTLITAGDADAPPEGAPADVDTVDINLDGLADIRQQTIWGATGNAVFSWWLFDADSGRFVAAPEFSEKIGGYTVDRARREITVRANGGHAGAIFEADSYRPSGRTLVRVRSVHQDWLPEIERYVRTTGRLEIGGWTERADTFTLEALPPPDSR